MLSNASIEKKAKKYNPLKILSNTHSKEEDVDIAAWMRFLREMKISKLFSNLPDERQQGKIRYTESSLLQWALSACAFRLGSKNALQTSLENLDSTKRQGMLQLLGINKERLPHSSTVDNAIARIPVEEMMQIPLALLEQLEKRKFFYNHPELHPNNALQIASDGFWIHTYDHPHATNPDGTNACPYCLPRTRHKGTEKEITQWVHVLVTFTLICEGLTLPIFIYPLQARQVNLDQTDAEVKEECELIAAREVLVMIRKKFPRTKMLFLGDASQITQHKTFIS